MKWCQEARGHLGRAAGAPWAAVGPAARFPAPDLDAERQGLGWVKCIRSQVEVLCSREWRWFFLIGLLLSSFGPGLNLTSWNCFEEPFVSASEREDCPPRGELGLVASGGALSPAHAPSRGTWSVQPVEPVGSASACRSYFRASVKARGKRILQNSSSPC